MKKKRTSVTGRDSEKSDEHEEPQNMASGEMESRKYEENGKPNRRETKISVSSLY